jgi:hypothetical protein
VVIQGPAKMWRLRAAARELDAKVGGLTFITDPAATCAAYPGTYCITVSFEKHLEGWGADYAGWFYFGDVNGYDGRIVFNTKWNAEVHIQNKRMIASHELLHAVGFEHHTDIGVAGQKQYYTFSPTELRVLRGWYGE